jgi:hypothetical protein
MELVAALAVLLVGSWLLAGCGGNSALSTASSQMLTHQQLVRRADAACRSFDRQIGQLPEPKGLSTLAKYVAETRSATVKLHKQLSGLRPPQRDRAAMGRFLRALEQGNTLLAEISSAAAAGHASAVGSLGQKLEAIDAGNLAAPLGLSNCATTPSDSAVGRA